MKVLMVSSDSIRTQIPSGDSLNGVRGSMNPVEQNLSLLGAYPFLLLPTFPFLGEE